ncbi:MAG TPA: FkbM family methyltransferase [Terriglobales bacterium]|nr:FkbM family methyltransferase [Terriglobales bacterium]
MTRQFMNTLRQIAHSDSVGPMHGGWRHLQWQIRKVFRRFPCELPIGDCSRLFIDHASGVGALVNAMGLYDFNNMSFLRTLLRRLGGVFVDVGANIGSYTLIASEVPSSRVFSIEPHPRAFKLLSENVMRNQRSNVTCLSFAVSDCQGWCILTDHKELSINQIVHSKEYQKVVRVPMRTLRSVCEELKITPDFIKIDVEGHEYSVLNGLIDMLTAAKVMWIERGERPEIVRKLRQSGYMGPLYVHQRTQTLRLIPANRPEDPVFVRRDCVALLERCNFQIQAGVATEDKVQPVMAVGSGHA